MPVWRIGMQDDVVPDNEVDTGVREWGWDFAAILRTVPGASELEEEGFTPIETLFGEHYFAMSWPEAHRREVRDTRFEQTEQEPPDEDHRRLFLVRSPWPSIELDTVVKLMFRWLRRNERVFVADPARHGGPIDIEAELAVVEQFFRQSEHWIHAFSKGRVNRLV